MNTFQRAALMIRSLMREARLSGCEHIVMPKGGKAIGSTKLLEELERPDEEHPHFAGWLQSHKDHEPEFTPSEHLSLTPGDREAGWTQVPLYRQPGPTQDAYMAACRALHWHTAQLRAHGIEPDAITPDAPHHPPEDHVFDSVRNRAGGEQAIAIAEHAFRAGFEAGNGVDRGCNYQLWWSDYDPPEELKGLV